MTTPSRADLELPADRFFANQWGEDSPLLISTTMTRPNYDWSAVARTTAANIQTFISYTTNLSGMAYIRESREQHSDQDCRPNSLRHGGLLNRNSGSRKMYTECPPLVLLFAHCSVSIGSGGPGRAGYPSERRKTRA